MRSCSKLDGGITAAFFDRMAGEMRDDYRTPGWEHLKPEQRRGWIAYR
jgi:hypothetical protein